MGYAHTSGPGAGTPGSGSSTDTLASASCSSVGRKPTRSCKLPPAGTVAVRGAAGAPLPCLPRPCLPMASSLATEPEPAAAAELPVKEREKSPAAAGSAVLRETLTAAGVGRGLAQMIVCEGEG
jgi:hypothetical protein